MSNEEKNKAVEIVHSIKSKGIKIPQAKEVGRYLAAQLMEEAARSQDHIRFSYWANVGVAIQFYEEIKKGSPDQ